MAAFTRLFSGDVRGALVDAGDAITAAAKVAHFRGEMIARHAAYLCRHEIMDLDSAWDDVARALALARQLGARQFEAEALAFRGELHRLARRPSECLDDLGQALAIFRETGMAFMGPMALGLVALATEDSRWSTEPFTPKRNFQPDNGNTCSSTKRISRRRKWRSRRTWRTPSRRSSVLAAPLARGNPRALPSYAAMVVGSAD